MHVHACAQARAHASCDRTGVSLEFFVLSLSHCHTPHTCMRVCSLLLPHICTHAHTHTLTHRLRGLCVGGESGEQWWVLVSVWSPVWGCVCTPVHVSVWGSPSVIRLDKGKHFILIVLLLVFSHSFIFALFWHAACGLWLYCLLYFVVLVSKCKTAFRSLI